MRHKSVIASITLFGLVLGQSASFAKKIVEPTPPLAYQGKLAALQLAPWASTNDEVAPSGNNINLHGSSSDSIGNSWWGGGYVADYQFWDANNNGTHQMVGGSYLKVIGKLLNSEKDAAYIRLGVHNWTGNVTNGEIQVVGKTLKSWFNVDQPINETNQKSVTFFSASLPFGIGPFSVKVKASAGGAVKLTAFAEMKDLKATMNMQPSARLNVTAEAGIDIWVASAKVVGKLDPLIEARMPVTSTFNAAGKWGPCWDVEAKFELEALSGSLKLVVDYLVDTYEKTIAQWTGYVKSYTLIDLSKSCFIPPFVLDNPPIVILDPVPVTPVPKPKPFPVLNGGFFN